MTQPTAVVTFDQSALTLRVQRGAQCRPAPILVPACGYILDALHHDLPGHEDADAAAIQQARDHGYCDSCISNAIEHQGELRGGMAVWEDSQGFVYLKEYETRAGFDKALDQALAEAEA